MEDDILDPLPLDINWDEPEPTQIKLAILEKEGELELGTSPHFPDGFLLYFPKGKHALVLRGAALGNFLTQALSILIMCRLVRSGPEGPEEAFGSTEKITLH